MHALDFGCDWSSAKVELPLVARNAEREAVKELANCLISGIQVSEPFPILYWFFVQLCAHRFPQRIQCHWLGQECPGT